jgi:hypothetical protein
MVTNVDPDEFFLRRSEERVWLLKAGFSGREIEALYLVLNSFEIERLAEPCWNCGNGTGFVNSQFAVVCDSCYEVVEE